MGVGEHMLLVQAPGFQDEKRALSVKGGEQRVLAIELEPTRAAPALATATQRDAAPKDGNGSLWSSPWLWTGVGAVVAGSIVTTLLLAGGGEERELEQGDVGGVVTTLRSGP